LLRVSIVTISFNQAEFLERTIESVLGQDYQDIEYIVVDPGSTDGSREIIRSFGSRIARVLFEPDSGPADGLNRGFAQATGEVFSFLNSDDILYPRAVSAAVRCFMSDPSLDVVSGHAKIIGPDDQVLRRTYSDRMSVMRYVYSSVALIQPSTFFRRSAYEKTPGFNISNRATWDGELFFSMARAGCKFGRSGDIWSGYRLHRQSITASKSTEEAVGKVAEGIFLQVMGRPRNRWDKGIEKVLRVWKHLVNPRNTMERIFRGPVFGRTPG
jgi:glycosyltransferase involved in cell wall biosynthesis